jgi:hypothetical protein
MQKKILVLNDLHVGSSFGLLPPTFTDLMGNFHSQNAGQKYLWERYIATLNRIQPQKIDVVVLNGDIIDGRQPKEKGGPLTLHRYPDQREACIKVLAEVKKRFPEAQYFWISGTPYHEIEDEVFQVANRVINKPQTVQRTLKLGIGNATVQFHHETAFTSAQTKGGSLEREIINGYLAEAQNGWDTVHCEVRAHCHYFAYVGRKDRLAIVCPAWQLQTDYTTKGSPNKNIPDLGCVVLNVDDSLLEFGCCPVTFTPYLYKHPCSAVINLTEPEEAHDVQIVG